MPPDGLDDFFDINGNYVGSSKSGNQIRIMNSGTTLNQAQSNVSGNTKQLTDYNYSTNNQSNRTMLSNVATHYAHKAGVSSKKSVNVLDV